MRARCNAHVRRLRLSRRRLPQLGGTGLRRIGLALADLVNDCLPRYVRLKQEHFESGTKWGHWSRGDEARYWVERGWKMSWVQGGGFLPTPNDAVSKQLPEQERCCSRQHCSRWTQFVASPPRCWQARYQQSRTATCATRSPAPARSQRGWSQSRLHLCLHSRALPTQRWRRCAGFGMKSTKIARGRRLPSKSSFAHLSSGSVSGAFEKKVANG